ncbi:KEOPS complex subunit Pcc1 [Saliphagus infecundisoli]|uniref:KEOPS complex subunit Pcc1 n=1 Tax=Saliphagus infecundisoli TaxID=1849069 RepID=A0ABD5QD43_9EURY|nr:KEOPS complex subunit Pcc1 [Saliphagus infecundisoli]
MGSSPVHEAVLSFDYDSPGSARIVAESVAREVGEIDDDRSWTELDREERRVTIEIGARDAVALRAALNTWFSLIDVAEQVEGIASRDGPSVKGARRDE